MRITRKNCTCDFFEKTVFFQINMSIQQLLEEEDAKIKWLHVNVIFIVTNHLYIVADQSDLVIMEVADPETTGKLEVNHGVRLLKPRKKQADWIILEEAFMKTKALKLKKINETRLEELKAKAVNMANLPNQQNPWTKFSTILNECKDNTAVNILCLVCSISRVIAGKFGEYKIVNIKDPLNTTLTLNLYKHNMDKLQENHVYSLTNLKKRTLKHDGSVRLNTTKYTTFKHANSDEEIMFENVKIANQEIHGLCIMITDLTVYKACSKHSTKLNEDGYCNGCQKEIMHDSVKNNFYCRIHVETVEDKLLSILIFNSHLNITDISPERKIDETIEEMLLNQDVKVYCNKKGDNFVAMKIEII